MSKKDPSEFFITLISILAKRAGQICSNPSCRRPTSGGHSVKDKATVIGEAAHIHGQTPISKRFLRNMTPEERGDIDNAIWLCAVCHKMVDTDEIKYPAKLLNKWKIEHEYSVLDGKKDILEVNVHKPILDLIPILGYTGGPSGHFHTFTVKNLSTDEVAISCRFRLEGFGFLWHPDMDAEATLEPKNVRDIVYPLVTYAPPITPPIIKDLFFVMEYKNLEGQTFISKRAIEQVPIRTNMYNELKVGKYFPPMLIKEPIDMRFRELLPRNGQRVDGLFEVNLTGAAQTLIIGVSDSLLSVWGFENEQDITAAIKELGKRKIEQMVSEGTLSDYQFQTYDFPNDYQIGYEGFKKACNALN